MASYRDSSEISSQNNDDKEEYETNSNPCFYCPFLDNAQDQSRQYHRPRRIIRRRRRRPYYPSHFAPHYYYDDYYYDDYDDYDDHYDYYDYYDYYD